MKIFTTAAMALALTGAAAAAYADNPNDQKGQEHQGQHQQHGGQGGGQQHGGQGGGQHNAGAVQGGPQHFNGQALGGPGHGGPGQGGPGQGGPGQGGVQRFNGQAFQHGQGQGQGQGVQHFNGQAVQGGGQQWQGRGQWQGQNGQVQRFNGQQGVQRFNGQQGVQRFNGQARGGFGFQNHALRGRDQGRSFYSANAFARQYHAERRFRFGGYRSYPSGWAYRSWYFGEFLPLGWFTSQYYLDWADYGLPPPPVGCEWIAEGPDAVLVDVWTGEVLSVYQGVFYWNAY